MALCSAGVSVLKFAKPVFLHPYFVTPGLINMQVRYAARKGYREKAEKAKREAVKETPLETKGPFKIRKKIIKAVKTVNLKKPDPPNDDVIIKDNFNYMKYSLSEAVKLHREYHHPTVYNNPNAPVNLRIEINMIGKTQFQFIKPFSGIASLPHPVLVLMKREVLVLCDPSDVSLALSCGASVAGGDDVIQKIKEGVIQPSLFEYVIAHISIFPKLTPIRSHLKNQMPKAKQGTLTNDLKGAIHRFLYGTTYSCVSIGAVKDTGFINCSVGTINMELYQLEENLKFLIKDIEKNRPSRDGEFISWIWCSSPPSDEEFSLDLSKYVEIKKTGIDDEEEGDIKESNAASILKQKYVQEKLMKENI